MSGEKGGGDIAGGEIFRAAGQMQAEERQRPVDMQTTVFADIAAWLDEHAAPQDAVQ